MSEHTGAVIVTAETAIKGSIRRCRRIEVMGYVEGEIVAGEVIVHQGGKVSGQIKCGSADVSGVLEGDIVVDGLLRIADSGSVTGTVQYVRLAMENGADLVAQVRNMPPRIEGDFEITVQRGRSARITLADITAIDPDDTAPALVFHVSNEVGGVVALMGDRSRASSTFTQSDLIGGRVTFVHDGSSGASASFDVQVRDAAGGDSGEPKTVRVTVTGPSGGFASVWS